MADVCFSKAEIVITQPRTELTTKFGLLIETDIRNRATLRDLKPEAEFQYGGRLFFQSGSSYVSAVD